MLTVTVTQFLICINRFQADSLAQEHLGFGHTSLYSVRHLNFSQIPCSVYVNIVDFNEFFVFAVSSSPPLQVPNNALVCTYPACVGGRPISASVAAVLFSGPWDAMTWVCVAGIGAHVIRAREYLHVVLHGPEFSGATGMWNRSLSTETHPIRINGDLPYLPLPALGPYKIDIDSETSE